MIPGWIEVIHDDVKYSFPITSILGVKYISEHNRTYLILEGYEHSFEIEDDYHNLMERIKEASKPVYVTVNNNCVAPSMPPRVERRNAIGGVTVDPLRDEIFQKASDETFETHKKSLEKLGDD